MTSPHALDAGHRLIWGVPGVEGMVRHRRPFHGSDRMVPASGRLWSFSREAPRPTSLDRDAEGLVGLWHPAGIRTPSMKRPLQSRIPWFSMSGSSSGERSCWSRLRRRPRAWWNDRAIHNPRECQRGGDRSVIPFFRTSRGSFRFRFEMATSSISRSPSPRARRRGAVPRCGIRRSPSWFLNHVPGLSPVRESGAR